jgi:hypothetical protein
MSSSAYRFAHRVADWWVHSSGRVRFAVVLLASTVVGWPLSALTFARTEPPVVLALSWIAISLTAIDILLTATVSQKQDES